MTLAVKREHQWAARKVPQWVGEWETREDGRWAVQKEH